MFELKKTEGRARRGVFNTPHGAIETPFFMNVGTAAAIKGGISSIDLKGLKTQVELCNTYHLHLRPGDDIIYKLGGLHKFMNWDKPILTDSGQPYRRKAPVHRPGGEHADTVAPCLHHCDGVRRVHREPRSEGLRKAFR